MDFKEFEVVDFLQDEFFVDWILHPNPESDHFWLNWINRHPERRQEVELARELIKSVHYQNRYALKTGEYSGLMEKIHQYSQSRPQATFLSGAYKHSFKIAASLVFFVSICFGIYLSYFGNGVPNDKMLAWVHSSTDYGQKKTILLPDGTKVILNSGSAIQYPENFGAKERTVKFEGEAFFDVAHNPQKPFIIESGALTTRVLGTSFNLKSFETCDEVSVSVVTGKVEIKTETGQTALLHPNDMGVFNRVKRDFNRRSFDREKLLAWTNGTLLFENEDLPTIFNRLERWYGVKFKIEDGVNLQGRYSGEYKRKSLELVLEGLSYTTNFSYQINQKTIKIYEKKN